MGKKSPAPPPAPDYAGAAQQQGIANLEAARLTARLSNPNVITPLGGQRVTFGRPQFNRAAYDAAMANWKARNPQAPSAGTPPTVGVGGGAAQPATGGDSVQMGGAPAGGEAAGLYGGMKEGGMPAARREALGLDRDYTQGFTTLPTGSQVPTAMLLGGGRLDQSGMGPGAATRAAQGYGGGEYLGEVMPTREMFTEMVDLDTPMIEQYLTPEAQATLEAQQRVERALSGLGEQAIGRVSDIYGTNFTPQGLPAQQFNFGGYGDIGEAPNLGAMGQARAGVDALPVNFGPTAGQYGLAQGGVAAPSLRGQYDLTGVGNVEQAPGAAAAMQGGPMAPTLQGQLDTSNLAAMPVNAGMTAQQAILSRLDPQLQRQRSQLETQLANQGLVRGGEAYNAAIAEQQQQENDLRTQAALQGLNLDMAARQQGLGEAQALGGFANQAALAGFGAGQQATAAQNAAAQQNFQNALARQAAANQAQQQAFGQRAQAGQFGNEAQLAAFQAALQNQAAGNQAIAQNFQQGLGAAGAYNTAAAQQFGQGMDIAGLYNAALAQNQQTALQQAQAQAAMQGQRFNQAQAAAAFQNAQRQAALQEQLALRSQPLNEIAAIMGGAQVQMPQFQAYQGADVAAAPIFGATQAAGNFAQQNYANQTAAYNARMGLYGSLAGAAGSYFGGGG